MTEKFLEKKLKIFTVMATLIFVILGARLAQLQLVQTQEFKTASEQNRIRYIPIPAKRGEILDRTGKVVMVKDRPVYSVSISYLGIRDKDQDVVINQLASILAMKPEEISEAINDKKVRRYEPIKIAKDVPLEVVTRIEENRLPGVEINVEPMRQYVYNDFMPHILGYVREITPGQLERHKDEDYSLGDRFGQAGIENVYEKYLRGKDGHMLVEVDKSQRPVNRPPLDIKGSVPGNNLVLNIDYKVQKAAEDSLNRTMAQLQQNGFPQAKAGAIVMLDVNTGKVIAMASKPGFDPNIFNGKITPAQSEALFGADKEKNPFPAFNNRAVMAYPPGSTFKMITAAAILEEKKASPLDSYFDPGSVHLHGRSYNCWKPGGHGTVDLIKAIQTSCNVYFYQMGLRAGVDNLYKYARMFGLGQKTGIDLPSEMSGLAPSPEWKKQLNGPSHDKKYNKKLAEIEREFKDKINSIENERERKRIEREKKQRIKQLDADFRIKKYWDVDWREFETIIMSIGQGYNSYTPLQLVNYIATIANGGTRYQPYLVDRVVDYKGKTVQQFEKKALNQVDVSSKNLNYVRQGMRAVTQPGGTAYGIFAKFPVEVAGKTGTAQTGKDKWGKDKPTHGWFVAYAPYDKPQVAVAAIMENAGHGGSSAGLVVRDALAAYFNIDQNKVSQSGGASEE